MLKILIPVDFSAANEILFDFALRASAKLPTEVHLLHVLQVPVLPSGQFSAVDYYSQILESQKAAAVARFESLKADERFKNSKITTHLISEINGSVGHEIAQYADKHNFDILLTSSKHKKGLEGLLMGTELMRIVRSTKTPVLCLSHQTQMNFNRLLFATDLSIESAEVFVKLLKFSKALDTEIHCAYINTPGNFISERVFKEMFNEYIKEVSTNDLDVLQIARNFILYCDDSIEYGILHCVEDHVADLLVIATHGRKGLNLLLGGSVTEDVLQATEMPVLVYNMHK